MLTRNDITPTVVKRLRVLYLDILREDDEIDFDVLLSAGQPLQRGFVWSLEQKQNLIKVFLSGATIGYPLVVSYRPYNSNAVIYKVIDGKQRISTLLAFKNNEFSIVVDGQDFYFDDLEKSLQFEFNGLNCLNLTEYHDEPLTDSDLVELFGFVNFFGTPQDQQHIQNLKNVVGLG